MFPLIVAWALIVFGALSAVLSFVEAPDDATTPRPCPSATIGRGAASPTCDPLPPTENEPTVQRRVIGGALLVVFGALLLFARAAFIPRE